LAALGVVLPASAAAADPLRNLPENAGGYEASKPAGIPFDPQG
jgi:hypothetical protein